MLCSAIGFVEPPERTGISATKSRISMNYDSLQTGNNTGNLIDFRPSNWGPEVSKPMAQAFLAFPLRNLTGQKIKETGIGFQKSGNWQANWETISWQVARPRQIRFREYQDPDPDDPLPA